MNQNIYSYRWKCGHFIYDFYKQKNILFERCFQKYRKFKLFTSNDYKMKSLQKILSDVSK